MLRLFTGNTFLNTSPTPSSVCVLWAKRRTEVSRFIKSTRLFRQSVSSVSRDFPS